MGSTNYITFEVSFSNTWETYIVNGSVKELEDFCTYIKRYTLLFQSVKEYDKPKGKFKRCSKQRFFDCIDYHTELHLLITRR